MNQLAWLQKWYDSNCNGDWEHSYGISIGTLDNPGWSLKVDLKNTPLEKATLDWIKQEVSKTNWLHCRIVEQQFVAFGGSQNLEEMITAFRSFTERMKS